MYDLLDQPIGRLSLAGRLTLWSLRGWVSAIEARCCPPATIAPVLAQHGVLPALPHLHEFLSLLNQRGSRGISLAPPACGMIGDDEAVLLGIFRNATAAPAVARATLALLLDEEDTEKAFVAVLALTGIFHQAGMERITLTSAARSSG